MSAATLAALPDPASMPTLPSVATLRASARPRLSGRVARVIGLTVETEGVDAAIGEVLHIAATGGSASVPAEVVALGERGPVAMVLEQLDGL